MNSIAEQIFTELDQLVLIDSHSHINPYTPASQSLADLLGYHYYTELAHSAGMPREQIEESGISDQEKVHRLFGHLSKIDNTVQWSWFQELAQSLFGFPDEPIDASNWEKLWDSAQACMKRPNWEEEVLAKSNVEKVFLTNDFDDSLSGFNTDRYVPCLRTDELVFHFWNPSVRDRFSKATGCDSNSPSGIADGILKLFQHFISKGARACAISLPPWFSPSPPSTAESHGISPSALDELLRSDGNASEAIQRALSNQIFWLIAEQANRFELPFDLMIGVNRKVYPGGVFQGQDLYDSRVSLIQYSTLFNAFPKLLFPISVLASVTNQELVDYAWIFPNVITHGHWWYSNTPNYIRHDLRGRLEAIPRNKQIGYYSDAYKLEFILPKFKMYKRILAQTLAEEFCLGRKWSEHKAVALGQQVLRGNVESVFRMNSTSN